MKKEKGITLIALVVTIIVLLILAGVAISMLTGDNGILKQAVKAKENTEQAATEETIKLAAVTAITNEKGEWNDTDFRDELAKSGITDVVDNGATYTVTVDGEEYIVSRNGTLTRKEIASLKESGIAITTNTTLTDANGDSITIPAGFSIASDSATLVKDGIVVVAQQYDKSEFVWVPVEDINTMYQEVTLSDGSTKNIGKMYSFKSDGTHTLVLSGISEPIICDSSSNGDPYYINSLQSIVKLKEESGDILEQWANQLQKEFDEMIKYVGKNKGFYVGRYETSLSGDKTKAQSIKGIENSDNNMWYVLYQREKEYSKNNELEDILGSSMVWGSQYDQMLIWMKNNGIDVTSTSPKEESVANTSGITGYEQNDKLNNVYDLLGNCYEWTLEGDSDNRIIRRWVYWP